VPAAVHMDDDDDELFQEGPEKPEAKPEPPKDQAADDLARAASAPERDEDDEFLEAIAVGATRDVVIPRPALEASDWGERIGRILKTAMEAPPNGVKLEILNVRKNPTGTYYVLSFRQAGEDPVRCSIETREFLHQKMRNPKNLGKWFRRVGNHALGRDPKD